MKNRKSNLVFLSIGGVSGYLYWRFIGCSSGTCPITSHWYASTLYGMLMGWLVGDLLSSVFPKKKENESKEPDNQ